MIKKVELPVFYGTLVLFQDHDIKEAFDIIDVEYDGKAFGAFSVIAVDKAGHQAYVIIFDECTNSTVAHEAVHTAYRIIEEHELKKDEELIAYLTGWVVTQCHKYLNVAKDK